MAIDTATPRSRRALLVGAVGGLGALAAQAMGRPQPVSAGGGSVILGTNNFHDGIHTGIARSDGGTLVSLAGQFHGVAASTSVADGVGVDGYSGAGLRSIGVAARTNGHFSQIALDADVVRGPGEGIAVRARTENGIAVRAIADGGHALNVTGRAVFDRSGRVSFAQGQSSRTIAGYAITAESLVVATIQGNVARTWVRGVSLNSTDDTFTIRLNKAAPSALRVGWFIVN